MRVGERVVHVQHGVCRIVGRQTRTVAGEEREYLLAEVLEPGTASSGLTVHLAGDEVATQLRAVANAATAQAALDAIRERLPGPLADVKAWRQKAATGDEVLAGDDLVEQARMLVDLTHEDRDSGLSTTLRRLRDRTLRQIAGEIAVAMDEEPDRMADQIEERLAAPADSSVA